MSEVDDGSPRPVGAAPLETEDDFVPRRNVVAVGAEPRQPAALAAHPDLVAAAASAWKLGSGDTVCPMWIITGIVDHGLSLQQARDLLLGSRRALTDQRAGVALEDWP